MGGDWLQQVVVLVLGGGGASAFVMFVRALLAVKNSADTREDVAIVNLEKWRNDAVSYADKAQKLLDHEREMSFYWQRRCGVLEHMLVSNGFELPPMQRKPKLGDDADE